MLWLKAFHVVAIISWMAGLLYVWRLFVYHAMTNEPAVRAQLEIMERKLIRAIMTPAAIAALLSGSGLIAMNPYFLKQPWLHAKLLLVAGMFASHISAMRYRTRLIDNPQLAPHTRFRVLNEVPTLLMIGIVLLVIVKPWAR